MLVLSRKAEEALVLDGGIKIKVLRIKHGRVQLGIEAPSDVAVLRSELQPAEKQTPVCLAAGSLTSR